MTDGAMAVLYGVLLTTGMLAEIADYILTIKALDKGFTEVGPVNTKVVAKWGKNALPAATILEFFAVMVISGAWATLNLSYGAVFAGAFAVAEIINDIRNILKSKKK
jgi:hypothetical protein